ncbi:pilus assembly protein TadG-related protein [Sinomonas notoginsengisoli]|uniref:pilus assembly protein TadG-related protein n=1 Tax=Sinomonas notoginsengisoli TaxID=1457311 RepID=UPI0022A72CF0|nr:pilus assembly protein TadG-related protein [Sinomonas notoginsengisoli]
MNRLPRSDREGGAVAIVVAVLMVALLGFGAIAIDVGRVAAEKAQLQNGADASALAAAQYCAKNPSTCQSTAVSLANLYTPANSNDRTAVASGVTFPASNEVAVDTSTPASGLPLTLARVFGQTSIQVRASATAKWGPPGRGSGFPLAFSRACYDLSATTAAGSVQQFQYKPGMFCTGPSGTQIPGGWGWLNSTNCQTNSVAGQTSVGSDPGNNLPLGCAQILQSWVDKINAGGEVDAVFPVFSSSTQNGNNGTYQIAGYATLKMIGWKLGGGSNNPPGAFHNTADYLRSVGINPVFACSGGNDRCVIAQFIRFDITDSSFGSGNGQDFGSSIITLIK